MLNSNLVTHAFDIVEREVTDGLRKNYVLKSGAQYENREANELFKALLEFKKERSITNLDVLEAKVKACEGQNEAVFSYQNIAIAISTIRIELEKETNNNFPKRKP